MKKTLLKLFAVYFLISIFAVNTQIAGILSANATVGDYPTVQCISLTSDLIYGSNDQNTYNQVTLLQLFLTQKGYEIGRDSFGIFGYGTKDAVAYFQKNNGFIPTGVVGSNTISLIKDISCNKNNWANLPATKQIPINSSHNCGLNNGWVWNGSQCVNTCDKYHPWNSNAQRCSIDQDYVNAYVYSNNTDLSLSCQLAYGQSYFWNGKYCVQINTVTYCGNSQDYFWNGSICSPKHVTQYLCNSNGQYYNNPSLCPKLYNDASGGYINVYDGERGGFKNLGYYDIYGIYHSM